MLLIILDNFDFVVAEKFVRVNLRTDNLSSFNRKWCIPAIGEDKF